jgi:MT0933-like antitoxin protein
MGFMDKAKEALDQHDDKVDQGLDKAGEAAKGRFAGHDEQIDQGVDRLQGMTGDEDTTKTPPPPPPPE